MQLNILILANKVQKRILDSEFVKNVLTLTLGAMISQVIPIVVSPILTRLYFPDDFGVLALFVSFASIIGFVSCGRYEFAIMLPKKNEEAMNVAVVAFIFNVLINLLFFIFLIFFGRQLLKVLNVQNLGNWLYFTPIIAFFIGLFNIFNYLHNRIKLYRDITITKVYKSLVGCTIQIIIGFLNIKTNGLIIGHIVSHLVGNIKMFKNLLKFYDIKNIRYKKLMEVLIIYSKFPTFGVLNEFIDAVRNYGIHFLFVKFFGLEIVGNYYFALRIVKMPLDFITSSLSQVYFKKITEIKDKYTLTLNLVKKLIFISLPFFISLYFFSPYIFKVFFGNKWEYAGVIARYLSPWLFINFLTSFLSFLFITKNKQEVVTFWAFIYTTLLFVIVFLFKSNFWKMLLVLSFSMSIFLSIYLFYVIRNIKYENK